LISGSKQSENEYGFACTASNADGLIPANFTTIPDFTEGAVTEACARSAALLEDDKIDADGVGPYESKSQLVGITISHDMDWGSFKSVTSYTRQDVNVGIEDNDGTSIPVSGRWDPQEFGMDRHNGRVAKQFSQELQFSGIAFDERLDYTFGVFAQIETIEEQDVGSAGGEGLLALTSAATGQPFPILLPNNTSFPLIANDIDKDNDTYAAFAQFSYDLTENLELTVGGRYTIEKRKVQTDLARPSAETIDALLTAGGAAGHFFYLPGVAALGFTSPTGIQDFYNEFIAGQGYALDEILSFEGDEDYNQFTPMVSLSYSLSDDAANNIGLDGATFYATWASGFKSGGLEAIETGLTTFQPEEVDNYELGFKLDALGNRLRLNGAIFQTDYEQIQIRNAQQFGEGANVDVIISNAGQADITGAELELTWQIVDSLQFNATAGFLNPDLKEFNEVNRGDLSLNDRSDENFQEVPDKTFSVALTHVAEMDWGTVTSRIDAYYRDEIYVGIDDLSWDRRDETTLDAYTVANARISWLSPDEKFKVGAWVNNLTDEEYFDGRVGVLGLIGAMMKSKMPPRTYGVDFRYSF
jgi:outer membrane receptor protein involved in Fe transport